jgi:hypothetical protein
VQTGGGSTSLTLGATASTSVTGGLAFHDSAPAINAAFADALNDGVIGGNTAGPPEVVLPAGLYWVSRIAWPSSSSTTLRQIGAIQLTTHPIIMDNAAAPSLVGQSDANGSINYNADGQADIKSGSFGSYAVEPIVIKGPTGGKTVRNVHLDLLTVRGIELAATPQSGANGFTIDNIAISTNDSSYGECLWVDGDAIFGNITNFRCAASTVTSPARPSIHFSSVSQGGSWIDLTFEHLFLRNGLFYVDSPTLSFVQSGSVSRVQHWKLYDIQIQSENTTVEGVFTVDSSCTEVAGSSNTIALIDTVIERTDFSDADVPLKGLVYLPRVGMSGCSNSGISPVITSIGGLGIPVVGTDTVGYVNTNRFLNIDPGDTSTPDANMNEEEGGHYFRSGNMQENNPLYLGFTNQVGSTEPILAALLRIPVVTVADDGAGGSCAAGTYYFQVAVGDGIGWTKASPEVSITTAGGRVLLVSYQVGGSPFNKFGSTYRIYVGTSSGAENTYYTGTYNTFSYTCAAGTTGTPQTFSNAYSYKLPSLSGQAGWFGGTDPAFKFGFGKTNPAYMLDVSGTIHSDTGFNGPGYTNVKTCSIVVGADNASVTLVNADLGPQGGQCFIPVAATVLEITVKADNGAPNVIVQKEQGTTPTALLGAALATAGSGGVACSRATVTLCLDGVTTSSGTLQNTSLAAGNWIGLASGSAGGTAKRMSIAVTYTVN